MNWYRASLLCLSFLVGGASCLAQSVPGAPAVGLGRPARWSADADAPKVFQPIRSTGAHPAAFGPFPAPTLVRGARPTDEPPQFLPKDLAPAADGRVPPPTFPGVAGPLVERRTPPATEPRTLPAPDPRTPTVSVDQAILPVQYRDDIIIVDEEGHPLFGDRPRASYYGSAEWLLWWTKGFRLPPLVTTASPADVVGTGPESGRFLGALGVGSTRLLVGNEDSSTGPRSGGRFTVGRYLDPCGYDALEATFFVIAPTRGSFFVDSSQFPVIARPFINANREVSDRQLVATPVPVGASPPAFAGFRASGSVLVETSSRIWGAEVNLRRELEIDCPIRFTGLFGFRYLELSERLSISERIQPLNPIPGGGGVAAINIGDTIGVFDNFETRNRFYGGQLGLNAECQHGRWTFDTRVKIGFGATTQIVDIAGQQVITRTNGSRETFEGGLLALNSNSGRRSQTRFSAVPEVGFKLGYALSENVSVFAGYDFLYWGNVLRPGDQVDPRIDVNRIPNSGAPEPPASAVRPVVPFRSSNYWAQGVTAGVQIRY